MQYPLFIHKEEASDFGVIVPDLPGCFSAGSTIEEALDNAREAIECHLEGLLIDNEAIPGRQPLEHHLKNPAFEGGVLALVSVDLSKIAGKTVRVNISLPERFLRQIDEYASQQGENRSEFMVDAAMVYMQNKRLESLRRI